jgi:hypothetical protein
MMTTQNQVTIAFSGSIPPIYDDLAALFGEKDLQVPLQARLVMAVKKVAYYSPQRREDTKFFVIL